MLVNGGAGQGFWLGSQIETGGRYVPREHPSYRPLDSTLQDPILWEKANFQAGLQNIKANPWGYLRLTARKFVPQWFEPVGGVALREKSETLYFLLLIFHAAFIRHLPIAAYARDLQESPFSFAPVESCGRIQKQFLRAAVLDQDKGVGVIITRDAALRGALDRS